MTLEEKEKLIKSFKSFKYVPETNIREEFTNVGIDWCIEEVQECDCGKKDRLDELLEKYNDKFTRIDDLLPFTKEKNCNLSEYDLGVYETLSKVIEDLESLKGE